MIPVTSILSQDSLTQVKSIKIRQISQKMGKNEIKGFFYSFSTIFLLKCGDI